MNDLRNQLIQWIRQTIPNYRQVSRQAGVEHWGDQPWWQEVYLRLFMWCAIWIPSLKKFCQGVGPVMVYPSNQYRQHVLDRNEHDWYSLVCHEAIHQVDLLRHPFVFLVTYFGCTPLWNPFRVMWELRAYLMEEWYYYQQTGRHKWDPKIIASRLASVNYAYAGWGIENRIESIYRYGLKKIKQEKWEPMMSEPFYMSIRTFLTDVVKPGWSYE